MNSIFRHKQMWQLIRANFMELVREPGVLFWGIIFPILMSVGLGAAFTRKADVERKIAVINENVSDLKQSDSTGLLNTFFLTKAVPVNASSENPSGFKYTIVNEKMGNTTFIFQMTDWKTAMVWLKRGYVSVVLYEKNSKIEYHLDPANSDAKLSYIQLSHLLNDSGKIETIDENSIVPLTENGTRYIDFLIPGLIAMGIMMSAMWGISYTIIERRSKKLLRRMVATPMKKSHFLISLIAVRVAMTFAESLLLFIFAAFAFKITIMGNILSLLVLFIAGNIAFAGNAIFISCYTSKTEIGNGLINLVVMPMMVLSGVFFSYHNFPDWAIPVIQKMPLTMLADGMRSVFIEGGGFAEVALPSLIMTVTGIVFFGAGLKLFKWH